MFCNWEAGIRGHPDPFFREGEGKIKQSPEKPFDKLRTNGLG